MIVVCKFLSLHQRKKREEKKRLKEVLDHQIGTVAATDLFYELLFIFFAVQHIPFATINFRIIVCHFKYHFLSRDLQNN